MMIGLPLDRFHRYRFSAPLLSFMLHSACSVLGVESSPFKRGPLFALITPRHICLFIFPLFASACRCRSARPSLPLPPTSSDSSPSGPLPSGPLPAGEPRYPPVSCRSSAPFRRLPSALSLSPVPPRPPPPPAAGYRSRAIRSCRAKRAPLGRGRDRASHHAVRVDRTPLSVRSTRQGPVQLSRAEPSRAEPGGEREPAASATISAPRSSPPPSPPLPGSLLTRGGDTAAVRRNITLPPCHTTGVLLNTRTDTIWYVHFVVR